MRRKQRRKPVAISVADVTSILDLEDIITTVRLWGWNPKNGVGDRFGESGIVAPQRLPGR
jgi:hypothetical protein